MAQPTVSETLTTISSTDEINASADGLSTDALARRDALRKIGRYGTYIAPAMLASFSAQAACSTCV